MSSPSDSPGDTVNQATVELPIPGARNDYIGPYKLLRKIGAGGMGEIYLGEDERLNRKVALKLLPARFTQDADRVRRFEQEAKAASALNHPNIITIHEIGEAGGAHYIVTEYIQGKTLRHEMAARRTIGKALDVATQMASALKAAHEVGIVHRDIKPENVMVRPDGLVKVLDFGIAKLLESASPPKSHSEDVDQETVLLEDSGATNRDPLLSTPAEAQLSGRASEYLSDLGYCYAVTGRRADALAILKELEEKYARRESTGIYLASVYAGLDDKDQAFAWLEKDFQQRSGMLAFITWWFPLEELRSDSRYADLVRRMGLSS